MTFSFSRQVRTGRLLLGVSLLAASTSLHAQTVDSAQDAAVEAAAAPAEVETAAPGDIVVTALKRSTSIQRTPLAISAISSESLVSQGITDSQQLTRSTPNLVINESANGGSRVIIRNLYAAGEALVGLYYDETALTGTSGVSNDAGGSQPGIRMFDLERAEVLRGPQGTLYGASSMGGTIRLIFNKPNLNEYQGGFNGQLTTVKHGSGVGTNFDGMVNVPIIQDKLAVRAVGFWDKTAGYMDNSVLGLKDFNRNRTYGGRMLVRFRPVEDLTIDGMAVFQNRTGYNMTWNLKRYELTGEKFDQDLPIQTPQEDTLELYSATLNWDFSFASLTAIASYSKRDLKYNFNYTPYFTRYHTGRVPAANVPGYANFLSDCNAGAVTGLADCSREEYQRFVTSWGNLVAYQPQSTKTNTQEIRLANGDNALKWTVGFFHSNRENFTQSLLNTADPVTGQTYYPNGYIETGYGLGATTHLNRTIDDTLKQIAAFGEATWDVNDKLGVTGGIRWFEYTKSTGAEVLIPNYVAGNTRVPYSSMSGKETGTLLKFNVNYKFDRDIMMYALAAQGYRPGGVNQALGLPSYATTYNSDKLWNYEIGLKTSLFDRKVVFNIDAFQMNWENIQFSASYQGAFGFITNSPSQIRIRGIEFDTAYYPIDGLALRASGSYTDAKLQDNIVLPSGIALCTGSPPYVGCAVLAGIGKAGNTVPFSPKWTGQASADYTHEIGNGLEMFYHANVSYRSSSWTVYDTTANNVTADGMKLPGFAVTGLRFGVQKGQDWGVYLFANNLFDVTGSVAKSTSANSSTLDPIIHNGNRVASVYTTSNAPRQIGLSFRSSF